LSAPDFFCFAEQRKHASSGSYDQIVRQARDIGEEEEAQMFLILAIVLVVVWLGSFLLFKTAGLLIHLLLLFAVVSLIMHFISGKRAV